MYNNYQQYNGYSNQGYNNNQYQQVQQQNYIPMYFVTSEDDVRRYIVMPNQIAYFKDMNSNIIYEKKADNFSNYSVKKYEMKDLSAPTPQYATLDDLYALRQEILGGTYNEQSNNVIPTNVKSGE